MAYPNEEGPAMRTRDQTHPAALEPIRRSVVVPRPVAETFALFTDGLDSWWPLHTHSIAADTFEGRVTVDSITFEKRVGGRVLERMSDGTEAPWGTILAWEPPTRFVMNWKPTLVEGPSTEVEVVFTPVARGARASTWSTAAGSCSATGPPSARATTKAGSSCLCAFAP
jgi:uncharacterized protein YndB with AHSA1/START domain